MGFPGGGESNPQKKSGMFLPHLVGMLETGNHVFPRMLRAKHRNVRGFHFPNPDAPNQTPPETECFRVCLKIIIGYMYKPVRTELVAY